jgi:hypothetical protein
MSGQRGGGALHEVLYVLLLFQPETPERGEPQPEGPAHGALSHAGRGLEEQAGQRAGQDGLRLIILFLS